jgi:hypothetical protein
MGQILGEARHPVDTTAAQGLHRCSVLDPGEAMRASDDLRSEACVGIRTYVLD